MHIVVWFSRRSLTWVYHSIICLSTPKWVCEILIILIRHLDLFTAYATGLDFGSQLPVLLPAHGLYNPNGNPALNPYASGVRSNRRRTPEAAATLRSAVLDEFRASKSRQWELRVRLTM